MPKGSPLEDQVDSYPKDLSQFIDDQGHTDHDQDQREHDRHDHGGNGVTPFTPWWQVSCGTRRDDGGTCSSPIAIPTASGSSSRSRARCHG